MKIGNLRRRVSIQAETRTTDGAGGYALAWTTLATVWASVISMSGREAYAAGHLEGRVTHKVVLRRRDDIAITSDMRLLCGDRAFNVRAVMDDGKENRWTTLLIEEGTAQ